MSNKIRRRLRSQQGETIAEVLIALLISAIALMMLAQMVGSSTNMVLQSERSMEEYYEAVTPLSDRDAASKAGTVSFSVNNMKAFETLDVWYSVSEKKMGDTELVTFYAKGGDTP